jgi:hypothetical protein
MESPDRRLALFSESGRGVRRAIHDATLVHEPSDNRNAKLGTFDRWMGGRR